MVNEQVTTVELTAGTPQTIEFSGAYPYYWVNNMSGSEVYAALSTPEADSDGTYTVAAGSQLRISGGAFNTKLNLLGSGKVQIIASSIASCPFKPAQGGGDTVKKVNGVEPVNGNVSLVQGDIPSGKNAYQLPFFVQAGTVTKASPMTVTFPVAYKTAPVVVCTAYLAEGSGTSLSGTNFYFKTKTTTTGITIYFPSGGAFDGVKWVAFGEV